MRVPPGLLLMKRVTGGWVLVPLNRITLVESLPEGVGSYVFTRDGHGFKVEDTINAISLSAGKMLKYVVTETTPDEMTSTDLPWEPPG